MSRENSYWRFAPLLPLSWLYGGIVALRNRAYDRSWFSTISLPASVISIGNLMVGGAGKTPMTIFLASVLVQEGRRVAIVARGYGRKGSGACIVSDGARILANVHEAGDEPLLLAKSCAGVPVVVDRSKVQAARLACERFHPEVILVDDGFQHRRLARDFDLVLVPASALLQTPWLLPAGPWREPIANLRRCQLLLLTGFFELEPAQQENVLAICRQATTATVRLVTFAAQSLRHLSKEEIIPLARLAQARVMLVSGIAWPWRFRKTVESLGADAVAEIAFHDHQDYRQAEIERIVHAFRASQAELLITTAKDAIKLERFERLKSLPCYILEIGLNDGAAIQAAVLQSLAPSKKL